MDAEWIWIDPAVYPELQKNSQYGKDTSGRDCVAVFRKTVHLSGIPESVKLSVSGDAIYRLYVNGSFVGQGPASAGGDFLLEGTLPWYYADQYVLYPDSKTLQPDIKELQMEAQVRLKPRALTEITGGQGGFYLYGEAEYKDGSTEAFGTDSTWEARPDNRFVSPVSYNGANHPEPWRTAVPSGDKRKLIPAPIPPLDYALVKPMRPEQEQICLQPGEQVEIEYDRIYSAYFALRCDRPCRIKVECFETSGLSVGCEEITLTEAGEYRSFHLKSIGMTRIEALESDGSVQIRPYLYFCHYPVSQEGYLHTNDPELDQVFDVCKWTLQICRQTLHLDSPKHQELLACTGDYYIESMMTAFTFGDMRLAALDIERTARWLEYNDGRMFHTNYSLIWVQWLDFVWKYTGDDGLVERCRGGLQKLLERFNGYIGGKGVLENPPDYMFVDWVVTEGYSMHHPPKYLGQTVLNAFYYKAVRTAAEIGTRYGWAEALLWQERADSLREAFNRCFYDREAGMYIDGLSDPTVASKWQPANVARKHFSRYANTLAALYDLCPLDDVVRLTRLSTDDNSELPPVQPYFMHYVLQAVCHAGLEEEYGLSQFEKWKPMVRECPKGLAEGWIKPEPTYSFDHSHAWGGTPAYHIPLLLTGFRMIKSGFKKIGLAPKLFGLDYADVAFPTPYGVVRCVQRRGEEPKITVPEGLEWELVF